jgi:Tfp pilus assembly protein PilV
MLTRALRNPRVALRNPRDPLEDRGVASSGFTLIETVAALSVFMILTVGIIPLLASSLKSVDLTRSLTVGKNLAQEAMERMRGLPYFDSAVKRDLLDLYFPNLSTGYAAGAATFTTTCTASSSAPAASAALACPPKNPDGTAQIPPGVTLTYVAQFVKAVTGSNPETYTAVTPPVGYDSASPTASVPPASLFKMTVTVSWNQAGKPRQVQLTSIFGDRKLSPDLIRANATVDFSVQALTSFIDATGRLSSVNAYAGHSTSDIELRAFAGADSDATAGQLTLNRAEFAGTPGSLIASQTGAQASNHSPPDSTPAQKTAAIKTVTNTDLAPTLDVAGLGASAVNEVTPAPTVSTLNQLPKAAANFAFTGGNNAENFWAMNQADTSGSAVRRLDASQHIFFVKRISSTFRTTGNTSAEATATTPVASRKVEAIAHAQWGKAVLLPTTFASGDKGVVVITNFTADVSCKSTGSASTAVATGSWSATLQYWKDTNPADGVASGSYQTVALSGSTSGAGVDPLAALKVTNPLVYDSTLPTGDVYLFDDPLSAKIGYLDAWSSTPVVTAATTPQTATVSMPYAINIVTAKTNPANAESKLAINIGKLSCTTADKRA